MFSGWTAPVGWALSSGLPPANSREPLRAQVLEGRGHLCHTRRRHAGVGLEPGVDSVGRGTGQPAEKLWQVGASKGHRSHCRWGAKAGRGRRWGGGSPALCEGEKLSAPDRWKAEEGLLPALQPAKTFTLVTTCSSMAPEASEMWDPQEGKGSFPAPLLACLQAWGAPPTSEAPHAGQLCLTESSVSVGARTGEGRKGYKEHSGGQNGENLNMDSMLNEEVNHTVDTVFLGDPGRSV